MNPRLRLRIRSLRGVYHWIATYGDRQETLGAVREFSVAEIIDGWLTGCGA